MGIDLWFSTRFVSQRPPILKVKVLNFKSIKVRGFDAEKCGFLVHMDPEFRFQIFKSLNYSPGRNFEVKGTKLAPDVHLSKLLKKHKI